ncbi:hypothetical protein, partial [Streptomyces sp. NRRL S-1896]|uniref:hypothetical protein n=1 Tax=Streptomyces sp. NRRL S-1896 TaxID=1463893 RepID=UPI0005690D5E
MEELLILSSATETEDVTDAYFTPALRRPGRELAMSMVFYSRSRGALEGCHGREADRAASGADCEREHRCPISIVRDLLLDAARQAVDEISRPSDGARAREATWSRTPRSGRWSCTPPPWTSTASTT